MSSLTVIRRLKQQSDVLKSFIRRLIRELDVWKVSFNPILVF